LIDIYEELKLLTASLESHGVEYALCGGLALAVHGYVRATVDLDLLILPDEVKSGLKIVQGLGYDIQAKPMKFADGKIIIYRMTKVVSQVGRWRHQSCFTPRADRAETNSWKQARFGRY